MSEACRCGRLLDVRKMTCIKKVGHATFQGGFDSRSEALFRCRCGGVWQRWLDTDWMGSEDETWLVASEGDHERG